MKNRRNFFRHDSPARELGRCCAEIAKTGGVLTRRLRRAEEQLGCRHEILQRFLKKSQIPNSKIWILWRSAGRLKKFCRRWVLKLVSSELLLLTCWRISAALPDFPSTLRELDSGLEDLCKRVDHFRQAWWWIPDFILRNFWIPDCEVLKSRMEIWIPSLRLGRKFGIFQGKMEFQSKTRRGRR